MSANYTLAQLGHHLNGLLHGNAAQPIQGVASLGCATNTEIAYFDNPALLFLLKTTQAGAVLLNAQYVSSCPVNCIVVPLHSINEVLHLFTRHSASEKGIHPTAVIANGANIGHNVAIGANTIIGENAFIADGVSIGANCWVAGGVSIGAGTLVAHSVSVHKGTKIGDSCVIESGVVLGARPFNAVKIHGVWESGPSLGGVIIADNVNIGSNAVIAKGSVGDTIIGAGVHIDNLVHIAHDVIIGPHTAIAGCAAIGAFAAIGSHCIIGGASCIAAHVHLADDVVVTGMSTVSKSLGKSGIYSSGTMVSEHKRWRRNVARFRRLDDYINRLVRLEKEGSPGGY
ncbi:MAG: UDP-3-O-(3-hydroxymyristoyl)glucosamine N-acyltransferase [Legionella sp.]|nr:UDP-3-O-(3-hydroxymyristoyl)glucosamine N-acyltransferase [Legionella sp.]